MGYIDPGTLGLISQIGYVLVFAVASSFLFLSKPLRNALARLRRKPAEAKPAPAAPAGEEGAECQKQS